MKKLDNDINILDVTIRDGSYAIDYKFTPDQVSAIAGALDRAGIDAIEVSHGCGLGAGENLGLRAAASDSEYVKAAKGAVSNAKIGVIAGPAPITLPKDIDTVIEDVDFIRFFTNVTNPRGIETNLNYARRLRPDITILMQLTNSSRGSDERIVEAARIAESLGVDTMYVVDTASHFMPSEVSDIIAKLRCACGIGIGFHGHDSLSLAVANTIAAVQAGATSIDASLRGIGRGGGNAQLESVISLLHRLDINKSCVLDDLIIAAERFVEPIMPPMKGTAPLDLITADLNISLYPMDLFVRIADAAGIPIKDLIQEMAFDPKTVESNTDDLRRALERLGANANLVFSSVGIKTDA